jgi:hypothetical protein
MRNTMKNIKTIGKGGNSSHSDLDVFRSSISPFTINLNAKHDDNKNIY